MPMTTDEEVDTPRASAWLEHHDEMVRATDLLAGYVEHPAATADSLRAATKALQNARRELEHQLASRAIGRGEQR